MHSWRVLILPYFCMGDIYNQYNFNEPWNGPKNRLLEPIGATPTLAQRRNAPARTGRP